MQHFWCYSQGFCWDLISHVDGLNGPCAMLFAQGGKLCVSRVRVKALLPFWRVLAISRPLTQPTLGIMGINEWYFVTLASCSHFGISTLQQSGVVFFCFVCCFCVLWLSRECVFVCNESECVFPDLWGKKKNSHINTFLKGNPDSAGHLFSETLVLLLATSQTREQVRSEKLWKAHLSAR